MFRGLHSYAFALAACAAALVPVAARAENASAAFVLVVDASRAPVTGIVHVHETMPVTPGTFDFAYPRWVPGEHGPEGPIQNVGGLTVTEGGKIVEWSRDLSDLNEFHVAVPPGVSSIDVDFDYLGSKDGTYGEARLATGTILAINWNQFLLYPQNADIAKTIFVPSIVLPGPDWTAETALPQPTRTGNTVTYAPATLERLVDSPLDAGSAFKRFVYSIPADSRMRSTRSPTVRTSSRSMRNRSRAFATSSVRWMRSTARAIGRTIISC
jgi:predicted metalloprotease with PDZ domain